MMRFQPEARRKAIQSARAEIALQPVYLDTETTGLELTDQIVEICIVDDSGQTLLESLVRPTSRIPYSATCIHGITNARVKNAPTWRELWPQVEAALTGRRVAIYNAEFDLRLMRQSHYQHDMIWQAYSLNTVCIMQLYAQFYGAWNARYHGYRWQTLDFAISHCGLDDSVTHAHRARADTLAARAVLHYIADQAG